MSKQIAARTREKWVDDVKIIACILVVVGHFFQSMVKASILSDSGLLLQFIISMCRCSLFVVDTFIRSTARWTVWKAGTEMWQKKRWRSAYPT